MLPRAYSSMLNVSACFCATCVSGILRQHFKCYHQSQQVRNTRLGHIQHSGNRIIDWSFVLVHSKLAIFNVAGAHLRLHSNPPAGALAPHSLARLWRSATMLIPYQRQGEIVICFSSGYGMPYIQRFSTANVWFCLKKGVYTPNWLLIIKFQWALFSGKAIDLSS